MTDEIDNFLAHFGVKGMKWGVRRDERALSNEDKALNMSQRTQVRVASTISSIAAVGMASNAAATLFQLQSRFEHLRILTEAQKYAENSPYIDEAGREALRQTRSHIVKGLIGSAVGATAIATAVGIVTRRTAKAYFAPLHKVYGDAKPKINGELNKLAKDIQKGKRPPLTKKAYEAEVTRIVNKHMTKDASNVLRPFHELARHQLGTELNTKSLKIKLEKLPNTDLAHKMTITTPHGLKLVKAVKKVKHVKHSADELDGDPAPDMELYFDYKFDAEGYVSDWSCPTLEIADDIFEGRLNVPALERKFDPDSNSISHEEVIDNFLAHYGVKGMKWGVRRDLRGGGGTVKVKFRPTYNNEERRNARSATKGAPKGSTSLDREGFDQTRIGKLRNPSRRVVNGVLGTKFSVITGLSSTAAGYAALGGVSAGVLAPPIGVGIAGAAGVAALVGAGHQTYATFFGNMKNNPKVKVKTSLTPKELADYQVGKNFVKVMKSERGSTKFSAMKSQIKIEAFDKEGRRVGGSTMARPAPKPPKPKSPKN